METKPKYEQVVGTIETELRKYQNFNGSCINLIQRLVTGQDEEGRQIDVPRNLISPKQLVEVRLDGEESDRDEYRNKEVITNVGVVVDPDSGDYKFVHDHPLIYSLSKGTNLQGRKGEIYPIADEDYTSHEGFVLTRDEIIAFTIRAYLQESKREALWEFLLEGDTDLHRRYAADVDDTLPYLGGIFNPTGTRGLFPTMSLWEGFSLMSIGIINQQERSSFFTRSVIEDRLGLVGVASDFDQEKYAKKNPNLDAVMEKLSSSEIFGSKSLEAVRIELATLYQK